MRDKYRKPIPEINAFQDKVGSENLKETIEANYRKVKKENEYPQSSKLAKFTLSGQSLV